MGLALKPILGLPTPPAVRLRRAERFQVEMHCLAREQMLAPDPVARVVWAYVEQIDVTPLLAAIRSTVDHAGNPASDPRLSIARWLWATIHGGDSARAVARRWEEHRAYRWLCGGGAVNAHTRSAFRTGPAEFLDRLLTDSGATLGHQDLIVLDRGAQDGMRSRGVYQCRVRGLAKVGRVTWWYALAPSVRPAARRRGRS